MVITLVFECYSGVPELGEDTVDQKPGSASAEMNCSQGTVSSKEPSTLDEFRTGDMIQLKNDREYALAHPAKILFIEVSAESCEGFTVCSGVQQHPTH